MPAPNLNPWFVHNQQSVLRHLGLKRAQTKVYNRRVLWLVIPAFLLAIVLLLFLTGHLRPRPGVRIDGQLYLATENTITSYPAGYHSVGWTIPVSHVRRSQEALASDLSEQPVEVYVKSGSRVAYCRMNSVFYQELRRALLG